MWWDGNHFACKGVEIDTLKKDRGGGGFKSGAKKRKCQKGGAKNFYKMASLLPFLFAYFLGFRWRAKKEARG